MKDRHWERIANVTKHKFDVESDNFLLRNIMEAPLLENKEDIEVSYHLKKVTVVSVKLLFLWCLLVLWKLLLVIYCVDLWVLYIVFSTFVLHHLVTHLSATPRHYCFLQINYSLFVVTSSPVLSPLYPHLFISF